MRPRSKQRSAKEATRSLACERATPLCVLLLKELAGERGVEDARGESGVAFLHVGVGDGDAKGFGFADHDTQLLRARDSRVVERAVEHAEMRGAGGHDHGLNSLP